MVLLLTVTGNIKHTNNVVEHLLEVGNCGGNGDIVETSNVNP